MSYFDDESDSDDDTNSFNEDNDVGSDDDEPMNPPNKMNKQILVGGMAGDDLNEGDVDADDADDDGNDTDNTGFTDTDIDDDEFKDDDEINETKKSDNKISKDAASKKSKQLSKSYNYDDDDDDDDDENINNESYLQKFNEDITKNYILNNHPECVVHNYNEVLSMCKTIRDTNGIIIDELHKTIPYLTKYERAKILGVRAKQINSGATAFIKLEEGIIDGYIIAEMELKEKTIPFIIRRPMPNGGSEYWFLKDLEDLSY